MGGSHETIRRKVARPAEPPRPPCQIWGQAFGRAAHDHAGLAVSLEAPEARLLSLAELLDALPERALLLMLENHSEALGLMALSPDLSAALLEMQTLGQLSPSPQPMRRPTRTDAAMTAPLIDLSLTRLDEMLEGQDPTLCGYRYASHLAEPTPLRLLLDDRPHHYWQLSVTLDGTERTGTVVLALPRAEARRTPPPAADPAPLWGEGPNPQLMGAQIPLMAELGRLRLPLSALRGWSEGMVIPLPNCFTDRVTLRGPQGFEAAIARLGQFRGHRALKLTAVPQGDEIPPALPVQDFSQTAIAAPEPAPSDE